jgi:CBS-domain-containing membrane protein
MSPERQLKNLTVGDLRHLMEVDAPTVGPHQSMNVLMGKILKEPRIRHVYVVDEQDVLLGVVRMNQVVEFLFPFTAAHGKLSTDFFRDFLAENAEDLMNTEPHYVQESTPLPELAAILMEEKINELPVVDSKRRVIGQVNVYEIITAFLSHIEAQATE